MQKVYYIMCNSKYSDRRTSADVWSFFFISTVFFFSVSDAAVVDKSDGGEVEGDGGGRDEDGDGAVGMFLLASHGLGQELNSIF